MIRKTLSSKKGASSIMVMLMLVVLVVFGVAALTTALSNIRLGQKVQGWNTKYYAAEGEANERYAKIDKAAAQAFSAGGDIAGIIREEIERLGFEAFVETNADTLTISYETWSGDIGISAVLSLDANNINSLRAVQWKEIQQ
jgi:Tfp pilus assembly protein PilX